MRDLVLFDIGGSLASSTHRSHLLSAEPIDWDAYHACCANDAPIEEVLAIYYDHFVASRDMWIVSSRSEVVRESTEDWLLAHGVYFNKVLLRPIGDTRAAADVKLRWLHDGTVPRERVLCAYESDPSCVSMYRAEGISCFHVLLGDR